MKRLALPAIFLAMSMLASLAWTFGTAITPRMNPASLKNTAPAAGGGGGGTQLVGDSTNKTGTTALNGNQPYWMWNGYVATASGSGATGKAKLLKNVNPGNVKMIVMDSGRNILATSNALAFSGSEDGVQTFTFGTPATITNGQTYFIAIVHDGGNGAVSWYTAAANGMDTDTGTSYATPRTPLVNSGSVSSADPEAWITN